MFPNNKAVLWQEKKKLDENKAIYVEGGVGS